MGAKANTNGHAPTKPRPRNLYEMQVYCPGNRVHLLDGTEALVLAVCIRDTGVTYEVAWYVNGDRKNVWISDREIGSAGAGDAPPIGFRPRWTSLGQA